MKLTELFLAELERELPATRRAYWSACLKDGTIGNHTRSRWRWGTWQPLWRACSAGLP